ncbi:MAG: tetraacyldisaccharide 4'-kinase [Planctomycetes bacterium]|nr:tetraacyldisaccharide 4'-kinase [Planctomycetota bacterium]
MRDRPVLVRAALTVLSGPFALAAGVRGALYHRRWLPVRRVGVPVVSVGNLTAGGTGKTPFVAWLVTAAVARGRRPAVLSRGYGPRPAGSPLSDEGTLLRELLPAGVVQVEDPDRVRGARRLLASPTPPDLVVLDDGFQHRRLHRDLDVVLLDATDPFGGGHLLPRGLLREPPRALVRAHVVVLTRAERVPPARVAALRAEVAALAPRATVAVARTVARALVGADGAEQPTSRLAGEAVAAWSGIGNPAAFEALLGDLGARVVLSVRGRDHHRVAAADLARVLARATAAGAGRVVVTHKDLVKLRPLGPPPHVVALDVVTEVVEGGAELLARALSLSPTSS